MEELVRAIGVLSLTVASTGFSIMTILIGISFALFSIAGKLNK
jgi:EamA domain-containing membrane protein RarD